MAIRLDELWSGESGASKLNPFSGIADAMIDAQRLQQQQQQLQLQRQQFEETKRRNAEDERLRDLAEKGEMARASLKEQREATAARQKLMQDRSVWANEFGKAFGQGRDAEGYAMIPQAAAMGIKVEKQDEVNGRPRFRIDVDPEATAKRREQELQAQTQASLAGDEMGAAGIGYQGTELDAELAAGADPAATEQGYLEATQNYAKQRGPEQPKPFSQEVLDATGLPQVPQEARAPAGPLTPARGPDTPDFMGAVPNDVIDVPAMQEAALQRLRPALGSIADAYPEGDQRDSAHLTAKGIEAAGMDVPSSLDALAKLRGTPDEAYNSIRMAEAQSGRAELDAQRRELERKSKLGEVSVMDQQQMLGDGFKQAGELAEKRKVPDALSRRNDLNYVIEVMGDQDPNNDKLLGPQISRLFGDSGAIALADVAAALGTTSQSLIDQGINKVWSVFYGGLKDEQKQAIIDTLKARARSDERNMLDYMDNVEKMARGSGVRPEVATGYRNYRDTLFTDELRQAWKKRWDATHVAAAPKENGTTPPPPAAATRGGGRGSPSSPPGSKAKETTASLGGEFGSELERQARGNGLDPDKIRRVIRAEGNNGVHPESGASGLIQWTKESAEAYGLTLEQIRKMSPTEQLPYAIKWFKDKGVKEGDPLERYYMAVGAPGQMDAPDDKVVYPKGSKAAAQNSKTWDRNQDGEITAGEMREYARGGASAADGVRSILSKRRQ